MISKRTVACALMGFLIGTLLQLPRLSIPWEIVTMIASSFIAVWIMVLYAEGYNE